MVEPFSTGFPIEDCVFGAMTVLGRRYTTDLLLLPDGTVQDGWWRREGHRLRLQDLASLLPAQPRHLIVGTGYYGLMALATDLKERLQALGIEMSAAPTCQAAEKLNRRWKPDTGVAGCFHLTC
jgi:hypothetical protein